MKQPHDLSCSAIAAKRLAPYEKAISNNFEMPLHVGKLIACWDRPEFVSAASANHMRDDDYVVGLTYKGHARAYPLWVTDNYHMINDCLADDPILFATCERCQSGSAFLAIVDGQPAKFSALGMYNCSLTMVNRKRVKRERHSLWLHYEGIAIDGPLKDSVLEQLPTFHMTWQDWKTLHPDTDVMLAPDDPHHRDARHGHGREEYFERPGIDPPLAKTITGSFDHRYPENEVVLGLNLDAGIRAYPLLEVKRQGHVVNDQLGDLPLVIFAGPRPDQPTLSAYARLIDNRLLTFKHEQDHFRDNETGTHWNIEGHAIAGELAGQQLTSLRWQYVRWHAWVYPHPTTELYQSTINRPVYPDFPKEAQNKSWDAVLNKLSEMTTPLTFSHTLVSLTLPHEATRGICIHAGDDQLNLYAFNSAAAAQDYIEFQGAWFCAPFDMKLARKRARRIGSCVLESNPSTTFAEPTQTVRHPDNAVPWSTLVRPDSPLVIWGRQQDDGNPIEGPFTSLIRHLREKRYDVVECAFLPHSQQRVGTLNAIAATIEGDRFAIYRCHDEPAACAVATEVSHALQVGSWVFRSIPILMYADPHYEMGQLPDDKISWSVLLRREKFRHDLKSIRLNQGQ